MDLRKGDYDYITKTATSITTYWFIDCTPLNQSHNFNLDYNFTKPKSFHTIQALVVASFNLPAITAVPTSTKTTHLAANSSISINKTISVSDLTSSSLLSTTFLNSSMINGSVPLLENLAMPFVCNSKINPEPNKTYGYFQREVKIRGN